MSGILDLDKEEELYCDCDKSEAVAAHGLRRLGNETEYQASNSNSTLSENFPITPSLTQSTGTPNLVRNLGIMLVIALSIVIVIVLLRILKCFIYRH